VIRPNGLWPTWMLEGMAVYFETKTSKLGRGRSPYYDAILRSYFNEGKFDVTKNNGLTFGRLSGEWPYFPGGETSYLMGYHLWNQFAKDTKNDQKIGDYSINSSHRIPFFIDGNLENVTGNEWEDYWDAFSEESKTRFSNEIAAVRKAGETRFTKISNSQYSATGGVISPDQKWLAFTETKLDQRQGLTLKNLITGQSEKIKDKIMGASMSFTPDSKNLIFSSLGRSSTFTEFSDLWLYQMDSKKFIQLTNGARAKDPQISENGKKITFISVDHGTQILKIADLTLGLKPLISNIKVIYQPSEFSMIGTPHWKNSSDIVFSLQELNQPESKIIEISTTPNSDPMVLVQNGKMNRFPFYCNQQLHYISDQTGIDNIYAGNSAITNVVTSIQFPFCSKNDELYGSLLTSNGFEIVKFSPSQNLLDQNVVVSKPDAPESITASIQSPAISFDESKIKPYSPWKNLVPRQWAPFGYLNYDGISGTSIGGIVLGFDSTGKHQYLGSISYNFKPNTLDQSFAYTYYGFRPAITLSEESFTSDIAADVNESNYKRTNEVKLKFDHLIRWTWSSLKISPYGFIDWNSYNDILTHQKAYSFDPEFSHPHVAGGGMRIIFSDVINSKLGFMPEGGSQFTTETQARVYQGDFTLWRFMTEYSKFIHLGNHQVFNPKLRYLGTSHPYGLDRSVALLKGKNTNDIFDDGRSFNLNRLQIRGYPNMTIKAKSSIQAGLDYHFPLDQIFNGAGPFFFNQIHGFVFGDTTYIPSNKYKNLFLPAFGLGITADTTLLWHAPVSLSLEMQYGTKKDFGGDQNFFLSINSSIL
jgi:hypothetical protein